MTATLVKYLGHIMAHPRGPILVGTRPQRGGGTPPSTDPTIVTRNNVLCRRRRFCFRGSVSQGSP